MRMGKRTMAAASRTEKNPSIPLMLLKLTESMETSLLTVELLVE
jgi:hypothetical protein